MSPINMQATAGLRLIGNQQADQILDAVRFILFISNPVLALGHVINICIIHVSAWTKI